MMHDSPVAKYKTVASAEKEKYDYNNTFRSDFAVPNLQLIQKMLNMVRDSDTGQNTEPNDILQNTLDHVSIKFVPKAISTPLARNNLQENKKEIEKYRRNVAVTSLLEAIYKHNNIKTELETKEKLMVITKPLKLLKPTDFIISECSEIKQKSNDHDKASNTLGKNSLLERRIKKQMLQPKYTFNKDIECTDKQTGVTQNQTHPNKAIPRNIGVYVPSPLADKYFQKYIGRSYIKQLIQKELWPKVELQIEEMEKKKKLEAELLKLQASNSNKVDNRYKQEVFDAQLDPDDCWYIEKYESCSTVINKSCKETECPDDRMNSACSNEDIQLKCGMQKVKLKQHRHLLAEDCIVCKVLGKMG